MTLYSWHCTGTLRCVHGWVRVHARVLVSILSRCDLYVLMVAFISNATCPLFIIRQTGDRETGDPAQVQEAVVAITAGLL